MGPFVSYWNNPFMAGQPSVLLKFALPGLRNGLRPDDRLKRQVLKTIDAHNTPEPNR
jgi:hypothetical protein